MRQLKEVCQPQNLAVNIIQEEVQDLIHESSDYVNNIEQSLEQDLVQDLVQDISISLPGLESYSAEEILLEAKVLAIRFKVSPGLISAKKINLKKPEFLTWLYEKDPNNLEWDFKKKQSGKGVYYYPTSKSITYEVREELLRLMKEKRDIS
jgi:hypothetical protein